MSWPDNLKRASGHDRTLIIVITAEVDMKMNELELNRSRFEKAVSNMNIPETRKTASASNANWFLRNGAMLNRQHPKIDDAIVYAHKLAN